MRHYQKVKYKFSKNTKPNGEAAAQRLSAF